ncbi:hypothetical protein E1A91_A03G045100v1 [Gossypium mustelinum]|uniref:Uncharacterized protein n=1 Tax=Gossypium mustelinum TaxID=34275 RepID=A0A5D2ZUG7_GOSMU|nr:hypothetical protein E1A91_A03G045100v1 [Gossypium mustelinum]
MPIIATFNRCRSTTGFGGQQHARESRCCCGYLRSTRRDKEGLLVAHVSEVRWMVEARTMWGLGY